MRRALALLICLVPLAAQAAPFAWPGGARAAVSLAYDDALDSQLDIALPALDKAGLKATFYLQLSQPSVRLRMADWRAAAGRGHELGNHSLFHQCSSEVAGRDWVSPERDLARTSARQMQEQVELANVMLTAIDGRRERTYTAPCGDLLASGKPYLPPLAAHFVAIKAGGADRVPASLAGLDPYAVPVFAPVGLSGTQLIEIVKRAAEAGTMANLTFHGIGGDYLSVSREAHEELLAYLAQNRKVYWTDTFVNIMKHVKAQEKGQERAR